ncbi:tubulin epsilon chain-like isoform X2 [Anthonomus grandis grandis]|uniref:tubulin epsilon chain-like isoform X2 n=1 Tax=Anthonomus grandis grandis TaxID=2921223 RepID=UPI0021655934|nr:tubulin epsilon chain-like isoform X2 [Anthonomus grandis grandis]
MSEFIVIQVGQCGNQIGSAMWPQILQEYNVPITPTTIQETPTIKNQSDYRFSSFFNVSKAKQDIQFNCLQDLIDNKVKARAICIDMEDSVVARFKTGKLKGLFDDKCLVTNYPGSGNNWAEGFCEHGPQYQEVILNCLRHSVERCDSLHGFLTMFSTGGGTGSGLGTFVLNMLADFYPKIERFSTPVYSTGTEDVITSPYNNLLATQKLLEHATCVFPVENRCLLNIVNTKYRKTFMGKGGPHLTMFSATDDMNRIVVDMLLHLTSGSRFPGRLNFDMNEINTNMVPFPEMKFISSGFNHITTSGGITAKSTSSRQKEEMFLAACHRSNQLIQVDPLGPKSVLLSSTLIGRGDYIITDLQSHIEKIQAKAKFTPWSKKSMKLALCNVAPNGQKAALFSLFNTTALSGLFVHLKGHFDSLFRKKAHLHHYTKMNNFDMNYFYESIEAVETVLQKYDELEKMKPLNVPRLKPQIR